MTDSPKDSGKAKAKQERFANLLSVGMDILDKAQKEFENSDLADILKGSGLADTGFRPAVEITKTADAKVFALDLPGVKKTDISVTAGGEVLTVSGTRQKPKTAADHSEVTYGEFTRKFNIPRSSRTKEVTASFKDGVLTVTVPCDHEDEAGPKKVSID